MLDLRNSRRADDLRNSIALPSMKVMLGIVVSVVLALSVLATPTPVAAGEPKLVELRKTLTETAQRAERAKLRRSIRERGRARVIVKLTANEVPDAAPHIVDRARRAVRRFARREAIGAVHDRARRRFADHGLTVLRRLRDAPLVALEVDQGDFEILESLWEVESIQEDRLLAATLNSSVTVIGGNTVHGLGAKGDGYTVAVLDTGVETSHQDFSGRVVAEACFSTTSSNNNSTSLCPSGAESQIGSGAADPCADLSGCEHGTHVAGIAVGGHATYGGVAPQASLIAVQVFSRIANSETCGGQSECILSWTSDLLAGLDYVYGRRDNHTIAAVNLSLGGGKYSSSLECDSKNTLVKNQIDQLRAAGIATVIAAGNDGHADSLGSPGCISTSVSVGATTDGDAIAQFSNIAPWLSLLAPGSQISAPITGGAYGTLSGTSMAAPHVAGSFAALRSGAPSASVEEIIAALTQTGVPVVHATSGQSFPRIQLDQALATLDPSSPGTGATEIVVDNTDSNASSTGTWRVSSGTGPYGSNSVYNSSGATFRWTPTIATSGTYEVYAWWTSHRNRSSSVPYTVQHASGSDVVAVDQTNTSLGGSWQLLGSYSFAAGSSGYVEVSSINGTTSADAVRFAPVVDPTPTPNPTPVPSPVEIVIDNRDSSTSRTGSWPVSGASNPWGSDSVYSNSGGTFRWTPTITEQGSYKVYVRWTYHANRGTSVPYAVRHAAGSSEVVVNQRSTSTGSTWYLLGSYDFSSGNGGYVELSSSNGQASADAVRLVKE